MSAPDYRYKLICKKQTGQDTLVDSILTDTSAAPYVDCLAIYKSKTRRSYMEACLMTGAPFEEISRVIEVPLDVISTYSQVFFNVRDLDQLSRLSLLEDRDEETDRMLKLWAVSEGLNFIAWRLGKASSISPTNALQSLFNMCIYKAKEGFFNPNSSKSSIEATKWAKLAMELGKLIKSWVHDGKEAKRDLELAIKEVVPDFPGFDSLD